jgi:hypothetical protein
MSARRRIGDEVVPRALDNRIERSQGIVAST